MATRPRTPSCCSSSSPGADAPPTVKKRLEDATAKLPIITVKDQREYAAEQRAPIDRLVLMIYALLGLALVIAVLGVVNTLGLSIIERTREVGLLRAIGLDRRQMRRMVALESVAIAVLGALMGIGMGLLFGIALMASVRDEGLEVTRIPWGSLGGYLLVSVVIGLLAALLPARRAGTARRTRGDRDRVTATEPSPFARTAISPSSLPSGIPIVSRIDPTKRSSSRG